MKLIQKDGSIRLKLQDIALFGEDCFCFFKGLIQVGESVQQNFFGGTVNVQIQPSFSGYPY